MTPDLYTADLFAGAGGTSTGLAQACKLLGRRPDLVAVNHWDIAVETHKRNHPWARHLCTGLDNVHPGEIVPRGRLDLLVASPECIHHSLARGGKPMCDQSRSSPWLVMKWLQDLYVDAVLIENVPEFRSWGPLGADGRPLKSKKGVSFDAFITSLKAMGYNVESRVLTAADYGDATVRERLFIQAKRGRNKKIYWPKHTHGPNGRPRFDHNIGTYTFGVDQSWKPARDIIDWTIPSRSIFTRKKPLAPATLERIAAGLKKFCGKYAEPFLVILRNHMGGRSLNDPIPALAAGGQHVGLCQPFMAHLRGGSSTASLDSPTPTITTKGAHLALVQPFITEYHGGHVGREDGRRTRSINDPLATQDTSNRFGLVEPFIVPQFGESQPRDIDRPLGVITTTSRGIGLAQPFVTTLEHGKRPGYTYSMDSPMPTITTADAWGMVEPKFLVKYYGTAGAVSVEDPLDTVTARDRFGLVELDGLLLDIHFRMLHWRELAAAQSFPADYQFAGNREQIVRQIGNAVPVMQAQALCMALLGG